MDWNPCECMNRSPDKEVYVGIEKDDRCSEVGGGRKGSKEVVIGKEDVGNEVDTRDEVAEQRVAMSQSKSIDDSDGGAVWPTGGMLLCCCCLVCGWSGLWMLVVSCYVVAVCLCHQICVAGEW
ncbi:hypothetical protein LOK49_LG02G00759 [Camellia lanceoleosa]|uniref:Uncharacterized protein n=1 Tax=Camellia lanceoleosa TaxID=1840588 RepID=A0ACC0ISB6_9ERIC|nr:hypothetical protein LOK49_LG02G00759 [Camellia lanceoleosa]